MEDNGATVPPSRSDYMFTLAVCFFVLWHKLALTGFYKARLKTTTPLKYNASLEEEKNQTDDEVVKLLDETSGSYELTSLNRWANIHRNDLENILPFILLLFIKRMDYDNYLLGLY